MAVEYTRMNGNRLGLWMCMCLKLRKVATPPTCSNGGEVPDACGTHACTARHLPADCMGKRLLCLGPVGQMEGSV